MNAPFCKDYEKNDPIDDVSGGIPEYQGRCRSQRAQHSGWRPLEGVASGVRKENRPTDATANRSELPAGLFQVIPGLFQGQITDSF
jgi:hypothetical protein